MKLSIGQAWSEATAVLKSDGGLIASVALALLVLPGTLAGVIAPPGSALANSSWAGFIVLLATLIAFAGQIAIARIALGPPLTVGQAITLGFKRFPYFFTAWILWLLPFILAIALVISATGIDPAALSAANTSAPQPEVPAWASITVLLLVIALIAVAARMLLLAPLTAAEDHGPIGLLKRSWQLSRGRALKLFGLLVLLGILFLVMVLGLGSAIGSVVVLAFGQPQAFSISALLLALFEGLLSAVISVFSAVLLARIYAQLTGGSAAATVPDAGSH